MRLFWIVRLGFGKFIEVYPRGKRELVYQIRSVICLVLQAWTDIITVEVENRK